MLGLPDAEHKILWQVKCQIKKGQDNDTILSSYFVKLASKLAWFYLMTYPYLVLWVWKYKARAEGSAVSLIRKVESLPT